MPIFAAAGIPWLATIIGGSFAGLVGFFAKWVTTRVAIIAAAVLLIVGLTTALFSALEGLLAGLSYVVPTEIVSGAALVTPSNLTACTSIIITAHMLRYAYDWNIRVIQYKMKF
jgi:hypothetical protein